MKMPVLTTLLVALTLLVGLVPAQASALDQYLMPRCGVGDPGFTPEDVIRDHGPEIYARATGFLLMEDNAANNILLWYLGRMKDADSRDLAERIVREGLPEFRRVVMGAVSASPDWTGLRIVAIGAGDAEEMTRDSACSVLSDVDYTTLNTSGAQVAKLRTEIVGMLKVRIAAESNPRLRGNLETALRKIQALPAMQN